MENKKLLILTRSMLRIVSNPLEKELCCPRHKVIFLMVSLVNDDDKAPESRMTALDFNLASR